MKLLHEMNPVEFLDYMTTLQARQAMTLLRGGDLGEIAREFERRSQFERDPGDAERASVSDGEHAGDDAATVR